MTRYLVHLTTKQIATLKRLAKAENVSVAVLIRRAIDRLIAQ